MFSSCAQASDKSHSSMLCFTLVDWSVTTIYKSQLHYWLVDCFVTSSALRSSSGEAQHTAWGKRRGRDEYIELASCPLSISLFLLACVLPYLELLKFENFAYVKFSSWPSLLESPPWRPNMCKLHCVPLTVQANKELPPWGKLDEVTPIAQKLVSLFVIFLSMLPWP